MAKVVLNQFVVLRCAVTHGCIEMQGILQAPPSPKTPNGPNTHPSMGVAAGLDQGPFSNNMSQTLGVPGTGNNARSSNYQALQALAKVGLFASLRLCAGAAPCGCSIHLWCT
jgi:hypothetical protein